MVGFVWLTQIIKLVYLVSRGVDIVTFVSTVALVLPYICFTIMPFSVSIGVIVGYNRLSNDRELLAISNMGISAFGIIRPAILIASFFTIFSYASSFYLVPVSYAALKENLRVLKESVGFSALEERVFAQVSKNLIIYADKKQGRENLRGVVVLDNSKNNMKVVFAKSGTMGVSEEASVIQLRGGIRQEIDQNMNLSEMFFDKLSISFGDKSEAKKSERLKKSSLQEYFVHELLFSNDTRMIAEGHQRIIWPLYNILLTIVSVVAFMKKPYRRRGSDLELAKIFAILIAIIMLNFLINNMSLVYPQFHFISYFIVVFIFWVSYLMQKN
jgi:lipopolysaccharide export system permease protein